MLKKEDNCQSVISLLLPITFTQHILQKHNDESLFKAQMFSVFTKWIQKKEVLRLNTIKLQDGAPLPYTVYLRTLRECSNDRTLWSVKGWVTCTGFPSSLRSLNRKRSWMCLHSWISLIWNKTTNSCRGISLYWWIFLQWIYKLVEHESSFSTLSATVILSTLNLVKCTCVGFCSSFSGHFRIWSNSVHSDSLTHSFGPGLPDWPVYRNTWQGDLNWPCILLKCSHTTTPNTYLYLHIVGLNIYNTIFVWAWREFPVPELFPIW